MTESKMWMIAGREFGERAFLYTGTWFTRKDAIKAHCDALGKSWAKCRAKNDSAVRVTITWSPKPFRHSR